MLDLAIWQEVDAIVTSDPDLLDLNGEYNFPIIRTGGLHQIIATHQDTDNN